MAVTPTALAAGQVVNKSCMYRGYSIYETAGSTAVVKVWAGNAKGGTLLDVIGLPANGTANQIYSFEEAENANGGIFIEIVSGAVSGVIKWSTT